LEKHSTQHDITMNHLIHLPALRPAPFYYQL
jgi:hypothetical protein